VPKAFPVEFRRAVVAWPSRARRSRHRAPAAENRPVLVVAAADPAAVVIGDPPARAMVRAVVAASGGGE